MQQPPRRRFTIGQWMVLVAVLAYFLSLPHLRTMGDAVLTASLIAWLPILYFLNILADLLVGNPCPGCGHWTLRRLARASSYFSCSRCGRRYQRFGLASWRDASGPVADAVFRGKSHARKWLGYSVPEDHGDTTTGLLVRKRRKRSRGGDAACDRDALPPQ
jgi:hypothetical protein